MLALEVIQPASQPRPTCPCRFGRCDFSPPKVRFYLVVWRQSLIHREPFEVIFRAETRESRMIDPAIRGGRGSQDYARTIRMSLEHARDNGRIPLTAWNAEKIAAYLCPDRWNEDAS